MADVMPARECKSLEARFERFRAEMKKEIEEQAEKKARAIVIAELSRIFDCDLGDGSDPVLSADEVVDGHTVIVEMSPGGQRVRRPITEDEKNQLIEEFHSKGGH